MPTGHDVGSEGREQGGGGGLPTGHDVPRPASVGVRLRSVAVVPAQPLSRLASGLGGVEDVAGGGLPATPSRLSLRSQLKETEKIALRAEVDLLDKLENMICPGCNQTTITFRSIKTKSLYALVHNFLKEIPFKGVNKPQCIQPMAILYVHKALWLVSW